MSVRTVFGHITTLLATAVGIAGFGVLYQGITENNITKLTIGIPLLLVGLWVAGIELGRSNLAAKRRRMTRAQREVGSMGS